LLVTTPAIHSPTSDITFAAFAFDWLQYEASGPYSVIGSESHWGIRAATNDHLVEGRALPPIV
jgi:hypothetical protein